MGVRKMTNQMDWLGFGSSCTAVGTAHSVVNVTEQFEERHDGGSLEQLMKQVLLSVES